MTIWGFPDSRAKGKSRETCVGYRPAYSGFV